MGLDVKVYQNIKITKSRNNYSFYVYVIDDSWKWKVKNLKYNKYYKGDLVDNAISYSYSTHNRFREKLVNLICRKDLLLESGNIDWEKLPQDIPFIELIDFADNEGCVDCEVAKELYEDFSQWDLDAKEYLHPMDYQKYKEWMNAFFLAKDNGVVVFR